MKQRVAAIATAVLLGASIDAEAQRTRGVARGLVALLPELGGLREGDKDVLLALFQTQTTTFPIGSSAGGFSWKFDPQLGAPTRRSRSFGPMFAERPLTTGRRALNVSLGFQRTTWQAVAGRDLQDGLDFTVWDYEAESWVEYRSQFRLVTEQTVMTAMFGLFDGVDIGVRVPFVHQSVTGTVVSSDGRCSQCPRGGGPQEGDSRGIGDVTIRGKVALPSRGLDLAAGVDLRLPTGDELQLLGSGAKQLTAMLIGSGKTGEISSHFNVGYTFAGRGLEYPNRFEQGDFRPSDEFNYTVGAEFPVSTPVTISADIIGRTIFKTARPLMFSHLSRGAAGLTAERATVNLVLGSVGAKFMVARMWLLTAAVAFPLNDNGIKPGITPVIGFERAF